MLLGSMAGKVEQQRTGGLFRELSLEMLKKLLEVFLGRVEMEHLGAGRALVPLLVSKSAGDDLGIRHRGAEAGPGLVFVDADDHGVFLELSPRLAVALHHRALAVTFLLDALLDFIEEILPADRFPSLPRFESFQGPRQRAGEDTLGLAVVPLRLVSIEILVASRQDQCSPVLVRNPSRRSLGKLSRAREGEGRNSLARIRPVVGPHRTNSRVGLTSGDRGAAGIAAVENQGDRSSTGIEASEPAVDLDVEDVQIGLAIATPAAVARNDRFEGPSGPGPRDDLRAMARIEEDDLVARPHAFDQLGDPAGDSPPFRVLQLGDLEFEALLQHLGHGLDVMEATFEISAIGRFNLGILVDPDQKGMVRHRLPENPFRRMLFGTLTMKRNRDKKRTKKPRVETRGYPLAPSGRGKLVQVAKA